MMRRKKFLIYPSFQLVLIFGGVVGIIACFGMSVALFASAFSEMKELGVKAGFGADHAYFHFLSMQASDLFRKLGAALLFALLFNVGFLLWISHRVVGPVIGLNGYLIRYQEAKAKGEKIEPIAFRKKDFFHDLVSNVNKALNENDRQT